MSLESTLRERATSQDTVTLQSTQLLILLDRLADSRCDYFQYLKCDGHHKECGVGT